MKKKLVFLWQSPLLQALLLVQLKLLKANLKSDLDSLSYSIGMAQTQGLKGYLTGRLNVDTAYMAEFIKGLNDGVSKTSKKDIAYMAGYSNRSANQRRERYDKNINQELFAGDSTKTISKDNFMAGFIAGTLEKRWRNVYGSCSGLYSYSYGSYQNKSFGRKNMLTTKLKTKNSLPTTKLKKV